MAAMAELRKLILDADFSAIAATGAPPLTFSNDRYLEGRSISIVRWKRTVPGYGKANSTRRFRSFVRRRSLFFPVPLSPLSRPARQSQRVRHLQQTGRTPWRQPLGIAQGLMQRASRFARGSGKWGSWLVALRIPILFR